MKITNNTGQNITNFAIRVDKNSYKLGSENIAIGIQQLAHGETQDCKVFITTQNDQHSNAPPDCP